MRTIRSWIRATSGNAAALVAIGLGAFASASFGAPTFVHLGHLPGGDRSLAQAVSADGTIIAGYGTNMWGYNHPIRWTIHGGRLDLLPLAPNANAVVTDMNAKGSAISGHFYGGGTGAFRWTPAGIQNISGVPGQLASFAEGISGDGEVVVGGVSAGSPSYPQAMRWSQATGTTLLPVLAGVAGGSSAAGANADGSVIVGGFPGLQPGGAARWTAQGVQSLGVIQGYSGSSALSVSADGQTVVGYCQNYEPNPGYRAFRWTPATGMQPLTGQSIHDSVANSISGDGTTVVGVLIVNGQPRAMMWDEVLGEVDLNLYLPTVGLDLGGWVLTQANGVSFDGSTIAGVGTLGGQEAAWAVSFGPIPPPPCADLTRDGLVGFEDISEVIAHWGTSDAGGDANCDGFVDFEDITAVLAHWLR